MNFAGVRQLPVVFVCDNNQWAYSTPTQLEYACETLADRADAYGFEGVVVDGTDVLAVYREAQPGDREGACGRRANADRVERPCGWRGTRVHDDASYVPPGDARRVGEA